MEQDAVGVDSYRHLVRSASATARAPPKTPMLAKPAASTKLRRLSLTLLDLCRDVPVVLGEQLYFSLLSHTMQSLRSLTEECDFACDARVFACPKEPCRESLLWAHLLSLARKSPLAQACPTTDNAAAPERNLPKRSLTVYWRQGSLTTADGAPEGCSIEMLRGR